MPIVVATAVVEVDSELCAEGVCTCGRAFRASLRLRFLYFVCGGCGAATVVEPLEALMTYLGCEVRGRSRL